MAKKPPLYTVYVLKQNYYAWCGGDYYDDITLIMSEYDDKVEAEKSCREQNANADKNYSYSVYPVVRSFPACRFCDGDDQLRFGKKQPCSRCGEARKAWAEWLEWEKKERAKKVSGP